MMEDPREAMLLATLEAIHRAADRRDRDAVGAHTVEPVRDLTSFVEGLPRPGREVFVGTAFSSERRGWFGVVAPEPDSALVRVAMFVQGHDGVWRVSGTMDLGRNEGESHIEALQRHGAIQEWGARTHVATAWSPVPATPTSLDDIVWLGLGARGVDAASIDAAERSLGARFPDGYREYVARFGRACDSAWVYVLPPDEIVSGRRAWQRFREAYWFWAPSSDGFDEDAAYESLLIAKTEGGDELLAHPSRPGTTWMLPRNAREVVRLDGGLLHALAWICEAGDLGRRVRVRYATPLDDRIRRRFRFQRATAEGASATVARALGALDPRARVVEIEDEDGGWNVLSPTLGVSALVTEFGLVACDLDLLTPARSVRDIERVMAENGLVEVEP